MTDYKDILRRVREGVRITPHEYKVVERRVRIAVDKTMQQMVTARRAATRRPDNMRQAIPKDIVPGNIIWYEGNWNEVETVIDPHDPHKAFISKEGPTCGLDGAMVEG